MYKVALLALLCAFSSLSQGALASPLEGGRVMLMARRNKMVGARWTPEEGSYLLANKNGLCIDTGIIYTANISMRCVLKYIGPASSSYAPYFGAYKSELESMMRVISAEDSSPFIYMYGGGIASQNIKGSLSGGYDDITLSFGSVILNGKKYNVDVRSSIPSNVHVSIANYFGALSIETRHINARYRLFEVFDSGVKVAEMYPRVMNGVAGMYDVKRNVFLASIGSANFEYGVE